MPKKVTLLSAVCVLIVAGLVPLLVMLGKSVWVDGRLNFSAFRVVLTTHREWVLLTHSLILSLSTTVLATLTGVPLGILFGKTDLAFRRFFIVLFSVPLLIPPYITAIAWFFLLGRRGLLSKLLGTTAGGISSAWLFSPVGCVWVLFTSFLPIVILITLVYLKSVDPRLEEAGRLVAGWRHVLRTITLPLVSPGILLAAMLVFLLTLGEYGVPAFLRYNVFTVESLTQFAAFYNFSAATAVATPLVAIAALALFIEWRFLREKTLLTRPTVGTEHFLEIKLGKSRGWLTGGVALFGLCGVILPLAVLLSQSFPFGFYLEGLARAGDSIQRSLTYAAGGATALTILGFLLGYLVHTRAFRFWRAVDSLAFFLFAMPGTVIGIGCIALWNRPATNLVYGTAAIIVIGYLARYTVIPHRMTVAALAHVPPSMEEAAQVAGAGWFRRLFLIIVPLAKRGLVGAWLVGFIFCVRDTGITMIVNPPGHDTLPVRIFTLMANGAPGLIAALCVIMVCISLLPLGLGGLLLKRRKGKALWKG